MRPPFASLFERRASLENPSTPISDVFGMPTTHAGVTVTEEKAEGIPTVYSCVHLIADEVAQLPFKLFRKLDTGGKQVDDQHPVYTILHHLANPELTASEFRDCLQTHLLLWGNAYAEIQRDARGRPIALWPLLPWRMTVDRDGLNRLRYTYESQGGRQQWTYDVDNPPIFHLRMNALDGIHGRSPVRVLMDAMGATLATSLYGSKFFANGARVSGVLQAPGPALSDKAKKNLSESFAAQFAGVQNAHKIPVLEQGMEFKAIGMPNDEAQFLETMKFQKGEIEGAYRVPPHLVSDTDKSTSWGTGIEQQDIGFMAHCLGPHLNRWEQAVARDLLNRKTFETHVAVFIRDASSRADMKSKNDALAIQRQNGIITANQWLALIEMNPIADPAVGDAYLVNSTMTSVDRVIHPPDPASAADPRPTPTPTAA